MRVREQASQPAMMVGKRARPPPTATTVKRTTSMTEFTLAALSDPFTTGSGGGARNPQIEAASNPHSRNSADFAQFQTPHFLTVCGLCHRRLIPGHDIYMYRGDSAFCSSECRQQQMNRDDDNKDKCSSFATAV